MSKDNILDFKVPDDTCLYCGSEEDHPGFSCPRIAVVIHYEATEFQPGAVGLHFVDDDLEVEFEFTPDDDEAP